MATFKTYRQLSVTVSVSVTIWQLKARKIHEALLAKESCVTAYQKTLAMVMMCSLKLRRSGNWYSCTWQLENCCSARYVGNTFSGKISAQWLSTPKRPSD